MKTVKEYKVPHLPNLSITKGSPFDKKDKNYHAWYNGGHIGIEHSCKRTVVIDFGKYAKYRLEKKRDELLKELGEITFVLHNACHGQESSLTHMAWLEKYKVKVNK